jgi:chromate transporter
MNDVSPEPPTLAQASRYWFKLGCISFGGPAGQIALMHTDLVDGKRWISERRFLHALNYCMLLPGPEAQQLATYIGWLMHRRLGALVAGGLFVLPSLLLLVLLSWLYLALGSHPAATALLWGVKPAVVAIVLAAAWRIGSRVLKHPLLWAIAVSAFGAIFVLGWPFPLIVGLAALAGAVGGRLVPQAFAVGGHAAGGKADAAHAPALIDDHTPTPAHARWSVRGALQVLLGFVALWALLLAGLAVFQGWQGALAQMGWFFTKAALLTFGGAYAVLPYVFQGAVEQHQWLSAAQMMDGLALGETTPGPLIMVVAFVGFVGGWNTQVFGPDALLLAGTAAATVATVFTFLPSFMFILLGGPFIESTHGQLRWTAPLAGITAAVVGVIVNLGLFFALHVVWPQGLAAGWATGDFAALALAGVALLALVRFKLGVLPLLGACAAAGLLWRGVLA